MKNLNKILISKCLVTFQPKLILETKRSIFRRDKITSSEIIPTIEHRIEYRVDENRFWLCKFINGELESEIFTKGDLRHSMSILLDMNNRYEKIKSLLLIDKIEYTEASETILNTILTINNNDKELISNDEFNKYIKGMFL